MEGGVNEPLDGVVSLVSWLKVPSLEVSFEFSVRKLALDRRRKSLRERNAGAMVAKVRRRRGRRSMYTRQGSFCFLVGSECLPACLLDCLLLCRSRSRENRGETKRTAVDVDELSDLDELSLSRTKNEGVGARRD